MLPLRAYALSFVSLLAGAATVHNIAKPDLSIPDLADKPSDASSQ